ncbi:MAG: histidine phosphatase family protein, partial [Gammaproteobacteria bacterium]
QWDRIVSSPLVRCARFARELSRRRSLPIELNQDLREMHFGAWEGRTAADLAAIDAEGLTRFWQDPLNYTPPGAETLSQLQSRTLGALKAVITQYRHQRLLLITHGGPIRILLCQALGKPLEKSLQIEVQPASLHRLCGRVNADGTMQVRSRDPVMP